MSKTWGVLFLLGIAGSASASTITLPGSWVDLELPPQWTATSVNSDGADDLLGPDGGDALVYGMASCASMWPQAEHLHGAMTDYGSDFLPSGWVDKAATDGVHISCKDRSDAGGYALAVVENSSQDAGWRDALVALLDALDASRVGVDDDIATMPGSGLLTGLPSGLRVVGADASARATILETTQDPKVEYRLYLRSGTCDAAVADVAGTAATAGTSDVSGFYLYVVGGKAYECNTYSVGAVVVVAPVGGAMTSDLCTRLDDELSDPDAPGPVQVLPNSGWKVAVPTGWMVTVSEAAASDDYLDYLIGDESGPTDDDLAAAKQARQDLVVGGGDETVISHADQSCDAVLASHADATPYDPAWLPIGWTAVVGSDLRVFCLAEASGTIVAEEHLDLHRPQLALFLQSLADENAAGPVAPAAPDTSPAPEPSLPESPAPPESPSDHVARPLLPFPITVAFQTIATSADRGYGVRGGVRLAHLVSERLAVHAVGEVGYDSKAKLAYDVDGDLALGFGRSLDATAIVGRDQIGTGDKTVIDGAWYYGLGGSLRLSQDARVGVELHFSYLWRSVPAGADPMLDPDREWRAGGALVFGDGKITGLDAEYQKLGDASTILIGARLRL